MLKRIAASDFNPANLTHSVDAKTLADSQAIVDRVRSDGMDAIRFYAEQFGERTVDQPIVIERDELEAASKRIDPSDLDLLKRVCRRIKTFAERQYLALSEMNMVVPGGFAGHVVDAVQRVGCYAPAGRFALPSTVLMTTGTARTAGCERVVLASPNPSDMILAAAWVGEADQVLGIGGAHAIAAMAYGFEGFERTDLIAGPGNRWVTAAKKIVHGDCGIDMLAGPSELALVADADADPVTVAADLLAQAEHDVDARPFLILTDGAIADAVEQQLAIQVEALPTGETAKTSLANNGAMIICDGREQAIEVCNQIAPEHLELHVADAKSLERYIRNAGCVFNGHQSAEVFGDYGIGPNHTLPTAGTARFSSGLNVYTFLRVRTWLQLDDPPQEIIDDTARLAEIEGLIGHQRSALRRS